MLRGGALAAITMSSRDRLLDQIRRLALRGMGERQTDGQLLELFVSERDEAAFALLLRRHGAMVWSVCHRVLGNAHDADDAFQAAFLVLVRKADSVRPREAVGNWLYGVAYRTSLEARRRIARRRAKEKSLLDVPPLQSKAEEPWQELWPILDRELSRLADKYRLPIVLCDLEGRSRKEVARQLAIPEGTLSSRLATARKKLAARLARYGFAISAASLGTLLSENVATASLSLSLLSSTTKAALLVAAGPAAITGLVSATVSTLTEGVLKTMFIAKIKTATLVLCSIAALGLGTGGVYYQTRVGAADSPKVDRIVQDNPTRTNRPEERDIDKLKQENERLRRTLEMERRQTDALRDKLRNLNHTAQQMQAELATRSNSVKPPDRKEDPNPALENLKAAIAKVQDEYTKKSQALIMEQNKALDEKQQKLREETQRQLIRLGQMRAQIEAGQKANPSSAKPVHKPASSDKLDQILERLDRLEKRLDRLENGRQ